MQLGQSIFSSSTVAGKKYTFAIVQHRAQPYGCVQVHMKRMVALLRLFLEAVAAVAKNRARARAGNKYTFALVKHGARPDCRHWVRIIVLNAALSLP